MNQTDETDKPDYTQGGRSIKAAAAKSKSKQQLLSLWKTQIRFGFDF
jgi:hypothetical protein